MNAQTFKKQTRLSSTNFVEDDWVLVGDNGVVTNRVVDKMSCTLDSDEMHNSWIATPPLSVPVALQASIPLNPIDNLLIEHPSMSVYEQITRPRRRRKVENKNPINENDVDSQQEPDDKSDITFSIQVSQSSTNEHRSLSKSSSTSNNDISSHLSKLNASDTSTSISSSLYHYHRRRTHIHNRKSSSKTKSKQNDEQPFVQRSQKSISTLHHTRGTNSIRALQQPHQRTLCH
ncbi:unnamed protein product [Didymodactylos carnosus]|uniref:Uncharacterized protein n=2 Tax=Didymodactylos carnosus TaxID=1234261 RepID=A0A814SXS9_9BILA|nr:unnamed protein product [Didymodactylos carnosus]CAF3914160.1 unnamed protein product [Didymodactylos carnosus]